MHINGEIIESVYFISSMLVEITADNQDKKPISRTYKKLLEFFNDKQYFNGPPENHREHIFAATNQLYTGNWKKCYELVTQMKFWK